MTILPLLLTPAGLIAAAVVVLSLLWWRSTRRPPGLPPGPGCALPLLGHLYMLDKDLRPKLREFRRQYGDVFSLYMGTRLVIVLNGYDVIKEALVKNAQMFSDRPPKMIFDDINKKAAAITGSSGPSWKEQRTVSLEILRELGMGKNILAERVQEEVNHYIKALESHQGEDVDVKRMTQASVSNNICSIIFGQRFEYDDPRFTQHIDSMEDTLKLLGGAALVTFMPWLKHIPGDLFKFNVIMSRLEDFEKNFVGPFVQDHAHNHSDDDASDFIHAYIREINKRRNSQEPTTVDEQHLTTTIGDLFGAGTETTPTAIRWALVFFLHHPHVQDKCYQEIQRVVGTSRPPSMRDKPELTYVEATITEVLRLGNIAPFVMHGVPHDTTLRGYTIPEDAIIFVTLESAVLDPDVWGDPLTFRPERFIDADGKLVRPDEFIVFGIGRRVCLGESLARMELFLYLTNMIQHFRFLPPEDGQLPSLEGILGLTHSPQPFKLRVCPRE